MSLPWSSANNDPAKQIKWKTYFRQQHLSVETIVFLKKYRTEFAASSASLASTLIAYPLDSIKTRMQAGRFPVKNVFVCVRETFKQEGYRGFMRGVTAPLASITLVRTISFSVYQKSKYFFDHWITLATGKSPLLQANQAGALPTFSTIFCFSAAGAVSGALITIISCPFELTKLSAQMETNIKRERALRVAKGYVGTLPLFKSPFARVLDVFRSDFAKAKAAERAAEARRKAEAMRMEQPKVKPSPFKAQQVVAETMKSGPAKGMGTWGTVKYIYEYRGFTGLYSGVHLHLLRDTIGTAIYFGTYESAKQLLANARGNSPTTPLAVVVAGGLCGVASWACIYPIDTAKSVYQRNVLTSIDGVAQVPRIDFFSRSVYRGLSVSMARSCLINAIFFSVFEASKKTINKLKLEDE